MRAVRCVQGNRQRAHYVLHTGRVLAAVRLERAVPVGDDNWFVQRANEIRRGGNSFCAEFTYVLLIGKVPVLMLSSE